MKRLQELQLQHDTLKDEIHELTYAYYKTPMNTTQKQLVVNSVFSLRLQCCIVEKQMTNIMQNKLFN